jgi:ankyrin repeat protein
MHVACYNNNFETMKYLFSALGPNCFLEKDSSDRTCLDVAINNGNKQISDWIESNFFFFFFLLKY